MRLDRLTHPPARAGGGVTAAFRVRRRQTGWAMPPLRSGNARLRPARLAFSYLRPPPGQHRRDGDILSRLALDFVGFPPP